VIFKIGDKVKTTSEFDTLSNNHVEGVVDSIDDEYAHVSTDDGSIISVGKQWLQLLS